jgi:hydrogenase nickel incorporation protein HypA/HybF
MHEVALMDGVISAITERVGADDRVTLVRLEVGRLAGVEPDALRFCFDVCASGTPLEGAALEILDVPGRARCRDCGAPIDAASPFPLCPCGSADLELLSGQELRIKEVEVI